MTYLCRKLFPTILEEEGKLLEILTKLFNPDKQLFNDIINSNKEIEFKNYVYKNYNFKEEKEVEVYKTPKQLLEEVGYNLYECRSEKDVKEFEKYYKNQERLCTFDNIDRRLNKCCVFFAVKKNVDSIKRKNFKYPDRQDLYGTSVISIQFAKGANNYLSIKNRYNHTVENCDATFSNNLDNIIIGLSSSFKKYYNLNLDQNIEIFELPNYVKDENDKLYRYNMEIANFYYCPNNIVINNGKVKKFNKEKYLLVENFVFDLQNNESSNRIFLYDNDVHDYFPKTFNDIKKISVEKTNENDEKEIIITTKEREDIIITIDKNNQMKKIYNPNVEYIGYSYLKRNKSLISIDLPNVEKIQSNFLQSNECLESINLPNVEYIGECFLQNNHSLISIDLPKAQYIDSYFLQYNTKLESVNLPNAQIITYYFLPNNEKLKFIDMPNIERIGHGFLIENKNLENINIPNIQVTGEDFLISNENLTSISLPNVKNVKHGFLIENTKLESVYLPNAEKIGNNFLLNNKKLKSISLPNVDKIGNNFLMDNENIEFINLLNVQIIGNNFLYLNKDLKSIDLTSVQTIGNNFLYLNKNIEDISIPNIKNIGDYFLYSNKIYSNWDVQDFDLLKILNQDLYEEKVKVKVRG